METEKDKRENPGRLTGYEKANVEWFNRQVEVEMSKGVPRAQAEQFALSPTSTRNTNAVAGNAPEAPGRFASGQPDRTRWRGGLAGNFALLFSRASDSEKRANGAFGGLLKTPALQKQTQGTPAVVGGVSHTRA